MDYVPGCDDELQILYAHIPPTYEKKKRVILNDDDMEKEMFAILLLKYSLWNVG